MAYVKYESEFYSLNPNEVNDRFKIMIHKKTGTGSTTSFSCGDDGFVMTMDGKDDTMLAPMKTTSVAFTFVIEDGNTDQEAIITDLQATSADSEGELCLEIQKYKSVGATTGWRRYWIGVVLSDLTYVEDRSPHNFVRIKAVDGLTQLKYKQFPESKQGTRSALYYIKAGLMEITSSHDDFGFWADGDSNTEYFLVNQPSYYNLAMGDIHDSTWRDDTDHNPLALIKISSLAFKDNSGQYWSYYKIIENILAAFHLRIMMTPIKDDAYGGGGEFYNGNCCWFIQAPLVRVSSNSLYFLNKKTLSTDVAVYTNDIHNLVNDPTTVLAGAREVFIPPLLSYKTVYNHTNFLGITCGPAKIQTAWSIAQGTGGVTAYSSLINYALMATNNTSYSYYPLTGVKNQEPTGWTGEYAQRTSSQKIVITGYCTLHPKNHAYQASGGEVGYNSAEEYFDWVGYSDFGNGWYGVEDNAYIMPRLALQVKTVLKDPDGNYPSQDGSGNVRFKSYWLGDRRFGLLADSTAWSKRDTSGAYGILSGDEDYNYPDNMYGYDGSWAGSRFWPDYPESSSYILDGIQQWGIDIGYSDMYWWTSTSPEPYDQTVLDAHHAFISPVYHNPQVIAYTGDGFAPITWDSDVWDSGTYSASTYEYSVPFVIESPGIPVARPYESETYGTNHIFNVTLYSLLGCDDITTSAGTHQRAACKSWDMSSLNTGGSSSGGFGCEARGIQWDYYLSDVRINITGVNAGVNSFDNTIGWYENENGSPSEEIVQEPEIILGDNPPEDPFAFSESSTGTEGFGGNYPGELRIHTVADDTDMPEDGADTQVWKDTSAIDASSPGERLESERALTALSHYYMTKRGLQLTFSDRTTIKEIEEKLGSGIYYFQASTGHKWSTNQLDEQVYYIVNGFTFVAGTGEISMVWEDHTTESETNLTKKTYSSNG